MSFNLLALRSLRKIKTLLFLKVDDGVFTIKPWPVKIEAGRVCIDLAH